MDLIQDLKRQFNSKSSTHSTQSFRASNRGTKIQNTVKKPSKAVFDTFFVFVKVIGNKDKTWDENAATSSEESRDTALARTIAQAVAEAFAKQKAEETKLITETFTRQMEKTQVQYEELLKASRAQNFPSTLKVTSSSEGFRVMDPFDWTHDKNIYQRW